MPRSLNSSFFHSLVLWVIILLAVLAVILGAINVFATLTEPKANVLIGDSVYKVKLATTDSDRTKGLSGTKHLAETEGMLFIFPKDDTWGIWMKDMHIPIDIIWMDAKKKVIHMERNVQPDAPPYITYKPEAEARYVLELPAGSIRASNIKMKEVAVFDLPETSVR